jgi:hypothetical protein
MSRSIFITAALALAVTLPAVSAQAQAPRTFVSAAGSDSNPCSFAAPCRHFQAAVNATSAGGEVDALDPAGYGPIIISQAITIEGQGWSYAAPSASSPAITINAVSGKVYIHGVSLNGVGITGTTTGIQFNSGASLNIRDSVIRNFTQNGINFTPNSASQISVSNTLISDNGGNGIQVFAGSLLEHGVFSHVDLENNVQSGLSVTSAQGGGAVVTISDSVSSTNGTGISASGGTGTATVMVRNSTIANNVGDGLLASSSGISTGILVTRSTIMGNATGWSGTVTSYDDNNIDSNGTANTAPPPAVYR